MFFANDVDDIDAEESVDLFFFGSGFDGVGYTFKHVAMFVEGHDDQELREEGDVFDEEREEEDTLGVVSIVFTASISQNFV